MKHKKNCRGRLGIDRKLANQLSCDRICPKAIDSTRSYVSACVPLEEGKDGHYEGQWQAEKEVAETLIWVSLYAIHQTFPVFLQ